MLSPQRRLNNDLLISKLLNETSSTAAKIHWILEGTAEMDEHIIILISKWKTGSILPCGGDCSCLNRKQKPMFSIQSVGKQA